MLKKIRKSALKPSPPSMLEDIQLIEMIIVKDTEKITPVAEVVFYYGEGLGKGVEQFGGKLHLCPLFRTHVHLLHSFFDISLRIE